MCRRIARSATSGWVGPETPQVFAPTASFNFDTAGFYTKWLKDVALDQEDDGAVPFVIPNVLVARNAERRSGVGGMGRRFSRGAVDGISSFRRQADSGGAISEHESLGRIHAAPGRRTLYLEQRIQLWRLAGVRHDGVRLSGSDNR